MFRLRNAFVLLTLLLLTGALDAQQKETKPARAQSTRDVDPLALRVRAAIGAVTGAAVTAAETASTTVVATPAVGTLFPALPAECATVHSGDAVIYNCSNVYYRPYYQGTTLVNRVVTYP